MVKTLRNDIGINIVHIRTKIGRFSLFSLSPQSFSFVKKVFPLRSKRDKGGALSPLGDIFVPSTPSGCYGDGRTKKTIVLYVWDVVRYTQVLTIPCSKVRKKRLKLLKRTTWSARYRSILLQVDSTVTGAHGGPLLTIDSRCVCVLYYTPGVAWRNVAARLSLELFLPPPLLVKATWYSKHWASLSSVNSIYTPLLFSRCFIHAVICFVRFVLPSRSQGGKQYKETKARYVSNKWQKTKRRVWEDTFLLFFKAV